MDTTNPAQSEKNATITLRTGFPFRTQLSQWNLLSLHLWLLQHIWLVQSFYCKSKRLLLFALTGSAQCVIVKSCEN